jgi:hypothetical protein
MRSVLAVCSIVVIVALAIAGSVASSGRGSVTLQTSASSYCSGDTVSFTLANDTDSSLWLIYAPPWSVHSVSPDSLIVPLYVYWLYWSVGPDSSITYTWNQKDYHGNQVPQGSYYVKVSGSLGQQGQAVTVVDTFSVTGASGAVPTSWGGLKAGWK